MFEENNSTGIVEQIVNTIEAEMSSTPWGFNGVVCYGGITPPLWIGIDLETTISALPYFAKLNGLY